MDGRSLAAYHEAGHAVLGAALHETPVRVSIRITQDRLGRCVQRSIAPPERRALVFLAGLAAEHVATGRRPDAYEREVQLGILAHTDPALVETFEDVDACDGYGAVRAVLSSGIRPVAEELRGEVDRLYEIARESIVAVWPSVKAIAEALLAREELDRDGIERLLGGCAGQAVTRAALTLPTRD